MDALSSQATVSGYRAGLTAAEHLAKFFPMFMTAAGTVPPAKVLVMGVGVAGLQAIATARRLGAVVKAYDVRAAAKEEAESLGATFLDLGVSAEGAGGYARELTPEELDRQRAALAAEVGRSDVVITTAAVPGRKAPVLVTEGWSTAWPRARSWSTWRPTRAATASSPRPARSWTTTVCTSSAWPTRPRACRPTPASSTPATWPTCSA